MWIVHILNLYLIPDNHSCDVYVCIYWCGHEMHFNYSTETHLAQWTIHSIHETVTQTILQLYVDKTIIYLSNKTRQYINTKIIVR